MRVTLHVGICLLYLAFGSVAGVAHVHDSADHHEEARGLHLDHGHVDHAHGHGHGDHSHDDVCVDGCHVEHHAGDAHYPGLWVTRTAAPDVRVAPVLADSGSILEPPCRVACLVFPDTIFRFEPNDKAPPGLRAPPA